MIASKKKNKSLLGNIVVLMLLSVLLKGIGFINRIVIAYFFGTTNATDIYYNAAGFYECISSIVLAGLSVGIINIYLSNRDRKANDKFISNVLVIITMTMVALAIICVLSSDAVSYLLAPGYDSAMRNALSKTIKVLCIAFPLQGIITVLSSVLQAENEFAPVKLTGTVTSVVSIFCVLFFARKIDSGALIVSFVTGYVVNAFFLAVNTYGRFHFRPKAAFKDKQIRQLMILILPLLIGTAGHELNLVIDKSIASQITQGAISAISYSCVLYLFVENVVINSIVTAILPDLTNKLNDGENVGVAKSTQSIILLAESLLIPIAICAFVNATNITKVVYMRGSFDSHSLQLTSAALMGYVCGLPFLAVRDITTRVFYAYKDTKTPVIVNLIAVVLNIILDVGLGRFLGIIGITLATSISNTFSGFVILLLVRRYNDRIVNRQFVKEMLIIFLTGILSFLVCTKLEQSIQQEILVVVASVIIAFLLEIFMLYVFKSPFLKQIINTIKNKMQKER